MKKVAFIALITIGCSGTATTTVNTAPAPSTSPESVSTPSVPTSAPDNVKKSGSGHWNFRQSPGNYSFLLTTDAEIQSQGGTGGPVQKSSRQDNVTLQINDAGNIMVLEPIVDSTLVGCSSPSAGLRMKAMYLIPQLPANLQSGMAWSDSVDTEGCSYRSSTRSKWLRNFVVEGEASFNGKNAVAIKRMSKITGKGEGSEGQHLIQITADGVDTTTLFVDPQSGKFIGSNTVQDMNIAVTTSGQTLGFKQKSNQKVELK